MGEEEEEAMGAAEHRLYGAMAAAVRNPCPPGPNPLSQQLLISIAGLTQALEECMSRGGGQPGQADYRGSDRTAHPSAPARESSDSRSARSTPPATLAAT